MTKSNRGSRYAGFRFTLPADAVSPVDVVAMFVPQKTVHEYVVALHDRDRTTPHIQGALLCPTRVSLDEMLRRLSRGLQLPSEAVKIEPLVAGRGRSARDAFLAFAGYLPHDGADQQNRGKALYPRESILVSDPSLWAQVDQWRERMARRSRVNAPLSDVETIELLLMYLYTSPEVVMIAEPLLWKANRARFKQAFDDRRYWVLHGEGEDIPDHLLARMPEALLHRLVADQ